MGRAKQAEHRFCLKLMGARSRIYVPADFSLTENTACRRIRRWENQKLSEVLNTSRLNPHLSISSEWGSFSFSFTISTRYKCARNDPKWIVFDDKGIYDENLWQLLVG